MSVRTHLVGIGNNRVLELGRRGERIRVKPDIPSGRDRQHLDSYDWPLTIFRNMTEEGVVRQSFPYHMTAVIAVLTTLPKVAV
jgi:hypothetical protein